MYTWRPWHKLLGNFLWHIHVQNWQYQPVQLFHSLHKPKKDEIFPLSAISSIWTPNFFWNKLRALISYQRTTRISLTRVYSTLHESSTNHMVCKLAIVTWWAFILIDDWHLSPLKFSSARPIWNMWFTRYFCYIYFSELSKFLPSTRSPQPLTKHLLGWSRFMDFLGKQAGCTFSENCKGGLILSITISLSKVSLLYLWPGKSGHMMLVICLL